MTRAGEIPTALGVHGTYGGNFPLTTAGYLLATNYLLQYQALQSNPATVLGR